MIAVSEMLNQRLIVLRISLQPRDPLFNGTPEAGADLKSFVGDVAGIIACS